MQRTKFLLGGLYAINELNIRIGIYDDDRQLKLINTPDKKAKFLVIIHQYDDGDYKLILQIKIKEKYMITPEENDKRFKELMECIEGENHLVT